MKQENPEYSSDENENATRSVSNSYVSDFVPYNSSSLSLSFRKHARSKSMSNICANNYSTIEIRRIQERLLRTNSHLEHDTLKKFTKSQKLTLVSLALIDFMSFCSMSIMAPFFPREAAEKGMTDTMSGFVFSFYALIMFLTSPIFGKILPRIGAKLLFLSGMFTAGVCSLLFGMLEFVTDYTLFTTLCLLIRGLEALGASAFSTASYVFVVQSFPNNIGAVLGILETFVGIGMSIGPAIGGLLYSLGGFDLPFFVLGAIMIIIVPVNIVLLPTVEEFNVNNKTVSVFRLLKIPAMFVTGLIVVVASSTWSFLDPTLEPHLRQFNLTPEKVGLIFLLFSGLYGVSSPAWGWLADKVNNHWSMMILGLFSTTIGLLLLGPSPYLPFLESSLWLNLLSLSILGVSVALTLLPTFQSVLNSAFDGGCANSIGTYSVVAGIWSCLYSLGEVIGPLVGGFLLHHKGFPITATIMASVTFLLAVIGLIFFASKGNSTSELYESSCDDSWRTPNSQLEYSEKSPLICSTGEIDRRFYTEEKIHCYESSRKFDYENGKLSNNQVTDVRGTISITSKGACEV